MIKFLLCPMVLLLLVHPGWGQHNFLLADLSRDEYSPNEAPAADVPLQYKKFKWVVTNKIEGKIISDGGAPVVRFIMNEPKVIDTVPVGTQIQLTHFRSYRGINYWWLSYDDESGKPREAWISGMLLERR